MPRETAHSTSKSRKSAAGLTLFPSLAKWEDPWEARVNLRTLRGRAAHFETVRILASDPRHRWKPPEVDRLAIGKLVEELPLRGAKGQRLAEDAALIADWYQQPALQARVGLGQERLLEELTRAAKLALMLHYQLMPIAMEAEHMLEAMPAELGVADDVDMLALCRSIERFARDTRRSITWLRPTGRKLDARRNVAIALATWAVEEATGQQVRVCRGVASRPEPHFANEPGQFVLGLLRLLGHRDERVLVGAFEKLRRKPRVTKPR